MVETRAEILSSAGFRLVQLANDCLVASFLPELGAKMTSLKSTSTDREFLLQPSDRPYRPAKYGADHGDLWSTAWQCHTSDGELCFEAQGRSLPYAFRKRVRLENNAIVLRYEIESAGSSEFAFLWSAHPLLAVEPGCRIVLPNDVSRVSVGWSREERLGKCGDSCGWPVAHTKDGTAVDLSTLTTVNARTADKLFTSRLPKGECALTYPHTGEALVLRFDPALVPHLGIWICQGGWPSPDCGHFTVALEPCTARSDSLREAIDMSECDVLRPGEKKAWELRLEVRAG
ncbi:MAG: hypothetical protein DMG93_10865 [Acidobacteria bacterium]|nr:MAG: hypothetical protein DMG93_10865 [Acidobacteriota bacterium]